MARRHQGRTVSPETLAKVWLGVGIYVVFIGIMILIIKA